VKVVDQDRAWIVTTDVDTKGLSSCASVVSTRVSPVKRSFMFLDALSSSLPIECTSSSLRSEQLPICVCCVVLRLANNDSGLFASCAQMIATKNPACVSQVSIDQGCLVDD
jgi:hypothetical protein